MWKQRRLAVLAMTLGIAAVLLACSRLSAAVVASGDEAPADARAVSFADVLGAAADAAAIVGTAAGLVALVLAKWALDASMQQLRAIEADQARIAAELSRKPDLRVSLGDDHTTSFWRLADGYERGADYIRFPVALVVRNLGQRSARNLFVSVAVPGNVGVGGPGADDVHLRREFEATFADVVHPSQRRSIELTVEIRKSRANQFCEMRTTLAYDDWPTVTTTLFIGVATDPDPALAEWPEHRIRKRSSDYGA